MDASPQAGATAVFAAPVKQLRPAAGDELFRAEFARCFPEFERQVGQGTGLGVGRIVTARGVYDIEAGRRRRFAGSANLPISRYHSVCTEPGGADAGTLCSELMTYWSAAAAGSTFPCLVDLTGPGDRAGAIEQLRELLPPPRRAAVDELLGRDAQLLVLYPLRARESVAATMEDPEFTGDPVFCELAVEELVVPGCLDLRLESHRAFFCTEIVDVPRINAHDDLGSSRHASTVDFIALLPAMLFPGLGGDRFHRTVGHTLRRRGYQGLVFPSARTDSTVTTVDGRIVEHRGWNFVDYRGAPDVELPYEYDLPITKFFASSLQDLGIDAYLVDRWDQGGTRVPATGYLAEGVAAQEWRRIDHELGLRAQGRRPGLLHDRFSSRGTS